MSTRDDARLTAQERAALAGLEARAAAEDPALAAQLGSRARRLQLPLKAWSRVVWDRWADLAWAGPLMSVAGLIVMVWSLDISALVGMAGAVIACAGLLFTGHTFGPRLRRRLEGPPGRNITGS